MLGVGSMGSMLSLLLAELGIEVFYYDPSEDSASPYNCDQTDIRQLTKQLLS